MGPELLRSDRTGNFANAPKTAILMQLYLTLSLSFRLGYCQFPKFFVAQGVTLRLLLCS